MNLIANSGIQFFTIPMEINMNDKFKMFFHEWFDIIDAKLKLEIAHYFPDDEVWVRKRDIFNLLGLGLTNGKVGRFESGSFKPYIWEDIKEDFLSDGLSVLNPMETEDGGFDCFNVSVNNCHWEKFENRWLPFPFFTLGANGRSEFAPTNWCRCMLVSDNTNTNKNIKKYNIVLAFDTRTDYEKDGFEDEDLMETPVFSSIYDAHKDFALCNNEFSLVDFCSQHHNCEWVDEYLIGLYHSTPNLKVNSIDDVRCKKPKLSYMAQYIYLVSYIEQLGILPKVTLFADKNVPYGEVDLLVDIGNSRTCAVLFDNHDFTKVESLRLQNFSTPVENGKLNCSSESFDMRLAFQSADFGVDTLQESVQFVFPSMVRLGIEANELIHKAINYNTGVEKITTFSSPKRYLWDGNPQQKDWEFVATENNFDKKRLVYIKGVSEQLNFDGSLNVSGSIDVNKYYSRKALMTFGFLEIMAQTRMQINSYDFRHKWGNENKPRRIGNVIVTCPTAMSKVEQIALRKCAEDAMIILDRFYSGTYNEEFDDKAGRRDVHVIPSVKELKKKEERTEWIYDESTCTQFLYLYSELSKRYRIDKNPNNCLEYFEFYGKMRNDLENYNKKSLTIGSVDIGAGTTDLTIAAYKYGDTDPCTLTPVPLFWESFYVAGDDLMNKLVRQLVIEGKYAAIQNKLMIMNNANMAKLILDFFAPNNARQSIERRQMRSTFNLQVSIPVVSHYLTLLNEGKIDKATLTYDDIFAKNEPTDQLQEHFKNHFGFSIRDLQWNYDKEVVSKIVVTTFDMLVGKISTILSYYGCDIVLLSGRPTSLKPLTDLFLKYYAISPNRLITLNNYRIGTWYPFQNGTGYFKDAKSIVAIGAMIGNYASTKGAIDGLSLNLTELTEKMLPTTEYFAKGEKEESFITPELNNTELQISQLPLRIWTRQLDSSSYPTRPFYMIDINEKRIKERIINKLGLDMEDQQSIETAMVRELGRIRKLAPYRFRIIRENYVEDKESLKLESVFDCNGEDLPLAYFTLQVQSMSETESYWLDSGEFSNLNLI